MLTQWFRCETLEHTAVKTNLSVLFDRYVPILQVQLANTVTSVAKHANICCSFLQDTLSKKFKKITPIPPISHIQVGWSKLSQAHNYILRSSAAF